MIEKLEIVKKRIFISPLDWGLGHASRLIPLISELKEKGHFILLGTESQSAAVYKELFPEIQQIRLKGYGIKYARTKPELKLLLQIPRIKYAIFNEYFRLRKIVRNHRIDVVISDSRFGLRHKNTLNLILSHQLNILYPQKWWLFGKILNFSNRFLLNSFDAVLIPDDENYWCSGLLSMNKNIKNQIFIGLLSRFSLLGKPIKKTHFFDLVFALSGPEPQRTHFEELILGQLQHTKYSALIISGKPEYDSAIQITSNIKKVPHLLAEEFADALVNAKVVISRSGYSSLMDYACLGIKQVVLIPTPGQTEQEYLAKNQMDNQICYSVTQKAFQLEDALIQVKHYKGFSDKKTEFSREILRQF